MKLSRINFLILFSIVFTVAIIFSASPAFSVTVEETFKIGQAERLENTKSLDVMVFPSYVEFDKLTADWKSSSVELGLTTSLVTNAPEAAEITLVQADVSIDGGKNWRMLEFSGDPEKGTWTALVDFPQWSSPGADESLCFNATGGAIPCNATTTAPIPAEGAATGTQTAPEPEIKKAQPVPEEIDEIIVCLRAEDSLGNVTAELFRQIDPDVEREVHFMPLINDSVEKDRLGPNATFENSPDRDITTTGAAWIRDHLFLKLDVSGTTSILGGVQPAYNYYMVRFTPVDTPTLNAQLGRGIYHYHTNIPKSPDPYENRLNRGFPFYVEYDGVLLYQLAAIINVADKTPGFPAIFEEYRDMLDELGLYEALINQEEIAASFRMVMDDVDLVSKNSFSSTYWRIGTDAFKQEDKEYMESTMIRFFTGFTRTEEANSIVRDDRTGYATIFLRNHTFNKGAKTESIPENPPQPMKSTETDMMKLMESYMLSK